MIAYHGTSAGNAVSILRDGFSLDAFYCGSLGKGIYFARNADRCVEYGRHILKVEIDEDSILKADFKSISTNFQTLVNDDFKFMSKFKEYTESKGCKGLELGNSNEIVVYDLSCIQSIKRYSIK